MKIKQGQELPLGYYLFWCWAANPKENPFIFFKDKYGYEPTRISIGDKVDIEIPDGIESEKTLTTIPGHIKLR